MNDVFDFRVLPHPKHIVPSSAATSWGPQASLQDEKAGTLEYSNLAFPHMHIMGMKWQTGSEDLLLFDEPPLTETVNINFQMSGDMYSTFTGLDHHLDMQGHRHNLVFVPEPGDVHRIRKNQVITLLHISLDKDFFMNSIGPDDNWSERAYEAISKGRPFSGMQGTLNTNWQMQQLIRGIYNCEEKGSMRRLLIQSRTLELLSAQIKQFTESSQTGVSINPDDQEKLYRLKLYLDEHFLQDMSLTQLARVSLLNEFKLKTGFKAMFNYTVFGYVRHLRMQYAKHLLYDMNMQVAEVALITGYEHTQHFSAAFKKHFGISPSQVKK